MGSVTRVNSTGLVVQQIILLDLIGFLVIFGLLYHIVPTLLIIQVTVKLEHLLIEN